MRPIRRAAIWARDLGRAEALARDLTLRLGFPVTVALDPAAACRDADIIVTTTPAEAPILESAWIAPGQHVTAMGSDAEHKNEIEPALVGRAVYVADSLKQTRRLGELHHAIAAGLVTDRQDFAELGQVIAGLAPGRGSPADITLCDLTGTGVQDTAIATLAHARSLAAGAGQGLETGGVRK